MTDAQRVGTPAQLTLSRVSPSNHYSPLLARPMHWILGPPHIPSKRRPSHTYSDSAIALDLRGAMKKHAHLSWDSLLRSAASVHRKSEEMHSHPQFRRLPPRLYSIPCIPQGKATSGVVLTPNSGARPATDSAPPNELSALPLCSRFRHGKVARLR
jgi:hypothetical protein